MKSYDLDLAVGLERGALRVLGERLPEFAVNEDHPGGAARHGPAHHAYLADHTLPTRAHAPPARAQDGEYYANGGEQRQDHRYDYGVERDPEALPGGPASPEKGRSAQEEEQAANTPHTRTILLPGRRRLVSCAQLGLDPLERLLEVPDHIVWVFDAA